MSQKFVVQDLVISITAKNLNPTVVNPDLLKYTGVVPTEWELAREPIYTKRAVQVAFNNGVNIIAEPSGVMFAEPLVNKSVESILVSSIAQKYAQTLPNMEFNAVGINLRGYISFDGSQELAGRYISEKLLAPGAWQEEGMRASLNLVYNYERAPLYLNITEAVLQENDETTTPIVMFSGRFNYKLIGEDAKEKLSRLRQALENLQDDLKLYSELINNKFLEQAVSDRIAVPKIFAMTPAV